MSSTKEGEAANRVSYELVSSIINSTLPAAGRIIIDSDSVQSKCEAMASTSDCSTLEELQEFIDRSYRDVSLRNDMYTLAENIESSTPFKSSAADRSIHIEERFCTLRENVESTVAALKAQLLEQTEIIAKSKQELCKLASENLHLKSRLAKL